MNRLIHLRRLALAGLLAVLTTASGTGSARALDDYTLPFFDADVPISYGMDRDRRKGVQLDWTGRVWNDSQPHYGYVYDQHTGLDFPMAAGSPVAAARSGTVVSLEEGFGTREFGTFGNFIRVRHADGKESVYYHLAQNGALAAVGASVPAGKRIGTSGCSGQCYGDHLHFELLAKISGVWKPTDPMYEQRWTTWPGRVPWHAIYVRESNSGTVVVRPGHTVTHWVEFRNTGGRPWRRDVSVGRTYLATWSPAAHASPYRASDWPYSWVPTAVDSGPIGPNQVGRFTFGIRGPSAVGSYTDRFNLLSNSLWWFDWDDLGRYYIPVYVTNYVK